MEFGERLKLCREKSKLNQKEVAEKIGVKNNTLHGYENGLREPSIETIKKLAELYEVTTDYLLGLSSDPKKTKEQEERIDQRTKEWMNMINQLNETHEEFFKNAIIDFIEKNKKKQ